MNRMDMETNEMVRYFYLNKLLGYKRAKHLWQKCKFVNGESRMSLKYADHTAHVKTQISKSLAFLDVIYADDQVGQIIDSGRRFERDMFEETLIKIERDNRPLDILFDNKAVINLTNVVIPSDVLLVLSWGSKFIFPKILDRIAMPVFLSQIEHTMSLTINPALLNSTAMQIKRSILEQQREYLPPHLSWLKLLKIRAESFFKHYSDLKAIPADKGKITIIINLRDYHEKLEDHLKNIRHYAKINMNPLLNLIKEEREILMELAKNNLIKCFIKPYKSNCMLLPRFYGTIKIHKDMKIRPITSNAGNVVGSNLNKVANKILSIIFPPNENHVININKLKGFTDSVHVPNDYILASYDAVSMFTNIPTSLVITLIARKLDVFKQTFQVEGRLIIKMLHFILQRCTYFMANGFIYKQVSGLPMGGSISTICCRIVMDSIIEQTLKLIPAPLAFKIYVDDTLFIIHKDYKSSTLNALNSIYESIQFTCEDEHNESINFLNITITRCENRLSIKWYRKPFSSFRLLNYYSSHKMSTILNTAAQFIKNTLKLSDETHFCENKEILTEILQYNCFPPMKIFTLLQNNYTLMRPLESVNENLITGYIPMPLSNTDNGEIKRIIYANSNLKSHRLTESIGSCKTSFVRGIKDKLPLSKQNNVIVKILCQCKLKMKIDLTAFNQTASMLAEEMCSDKDRCDVFGHAFRRVTFIKGLATLEQSRFYLRYLYWKYRNIIVNKDKFDFPNKYFRALF